MKTPSPSRSFGSVVGAEGELGSRRRKNNFEQFGQQFFFYWTWLPCQLGQISNPGRSRLASKRIVFHRPCFHLSDSMLREGRALRQLTCGLLVVPSSRNMKCEALRRLLAGGFEPIDPCRSGRPMYKEPCALLTRLGFHAKRIRVFLAFHKCSRISMDVCVQRAKAGDMLSSPSLAFCFPCPPFPKQLSAQPQFNLLHPSSLNLVPTSAA